MTETQIRAKVVAQAVSWLGKKESDSYVPAVGDVIFYDWDDSGSGDCTGAPDHVGIITAVNGTTLTVIEGNISDAVGYRTMTVGGKYIRGYGIPDYASKATDDYAEVTTAIQSLADKGIINSPDYWLEAVKANTVAYLDSLVIQADGILKSTSCAISCAILGKRGFSYVKGK